MKFGVISFPGSNCDDDLIYSMRQNLQQEVVKLWHKERDIQGCDFLFLPGGFSYGDYLRSGAIARFSPIMNEVIAHAKKGGYVMGICNGFQMLTEAGMLEGALMRNKSMNFICKNVYIKPVHLDSILTQSLENRAYKIPIAHANGNYFCSEDVLKSLWDNEQILFQYCTEKGSITRSSNPNGSLDNIAGICNAERNVLGIMPHPERATDEMLHNLDGKLILESLI
ncbi:MAG: phosphoribosylformylglycinamidine synthase subunit PurQ [Bacteroidota bacterium]